LKGFKMGLLGTAFKVSSMEVKNRFLRSATMEYMADIEGFVTDDLLKLYYDLSKGGAGLVITGCAAVEPEGRAWDHQLSVWDDKFIPGLKKLSGIIHAYGDECKCAVQLHHQGTAGYGYSYGAVDRGYSLKDVDEKDILRTIDSFGEAAARVKEAGFDAVALHGAHGYLLSEFLSPIMNTRNDVWGGSAENRMRFVSEVYRAIREKVGNDTPILWKLNTSDYLEGGAEVEDYGIVAERLARMGVDLIEMSGGIKEQIKLRAKLKKEAGAKETYFSGAIPPFREAVGDLPLAVTGGIRSPEVMEHLLENDVDFIGISRPLIAEPDLPNRILHGPDKRPSKCTSCNKCLIRISRQSLRCVEYDEFQDILKSI
jgi:2,4-dienoyl-CoA reductase-like NADH-dependent reductase (Old Yellow Enzyme family)